MRKIPANEGRASSPTPSGPPATHASAPGALWTQGTGIPQKSTENLSSREDARWASSQTNASSQFRYSREFILGLFDADVKPPEDFEHHEGFTSETVLIPMANIPLTETERKLFTSQSVNSDISTRRPPYGRQESKDGVRPPRAPGSAQRAYSNRDRTDSFRQRNKTEPSGDDDPWDTPSGVGSFSGNGFFSNEEELSRAKISEHKDLDWGRVRDPPVRTASPAPIGKKDRGTQDAGSPTRSNRSVSPLKKGPLTSATSGPSNVAAIGPSGIPASQAKSDLDSHRPTVARSASFADMFGTFGQSAVNPPVASMTSLHGLSLGRHTPDPIHPPSMSRTVSKDSIGHLPMLPPGIAQPVAVASVFVAPKWQYKDPSGAVQGPFTPVQMHDWYKAGYFNGDLPVKHVDDFNYEPLSRLLQRYGEDQPFIADLEEFERRYHEQLQRRVPASNLGMSSAAGLQDFYAPDVVTPSTVGFNPLNAFGGNPVTPGLFTPGTLGADPLNGVGRDRFGSTGLDVGSNGFSRGGWGDPAGLGRSGWSGLASDLASPFVRPSGIGTPGSPATVYQGSYFDQRNQIAQGDTYMGVMGQRQPSHSAFGFGPQSAATHAAPQSPAAAALFASQSLDYGKPANSAAHPEWGTFGAIRSNIAEPTGTGPAVQLPYNDEPHAPIDVVSKLIDEPVPDNVEFKTDKGLPEQSTHLGVSDEGKAIDDKLVQQPKKATEPSGTKNRKARREEQRQSEKKHEARTPDGSKNLDANPAPQAGVPAVDLRAIMSEEEIRRKKEEEDSNTERATQLEREIAELQQQQDAQEKKLASAWASGRKGDQPKLSLKEIQEMEQKQREAADRERERRTQELLLQQAALLQEQEAAANTPWIKDSSAVWSSTRPVATRQKSLAEIMAEEEKRKKKEADRAGQQSEIASSGARKYAELASPSVSSATTSAAGWATAGSSQRNSATSRPVNVIASSGTVKPTTTDATGGAWNVVGKQGHVMKPPAPPAPAPAPAPRPAIVSVNVDSVPSSRPAHSNRTTGSSSAEDLSLKIGPGGMSAGFMQWCRQALRPLQQSSAAGVKVDDFVQILLSIPQNDSATLQMICDDTLGHLTAIDPRKFSLEFNQRRKADGSAEGWSTVTGSGAGYTTGAPVGGLEEFDSGNKFVVVKKGKGKKKRV
ncbi:hypothetical protein HDU85_006888 [Gaertneriomyces sp. JEL0708]|nr:hypothetical protein HDU85_006888 [Gaertneriomyces sp. JEL0708]